MFTSSISLSDLDGTNGFRLDGTAEGDRSGLSVASAGDVNADGIGDLIIGADGANGAAGESYVVFGRASGFEPSLSLSDLNGTNGFRLDGIAEGDRSGRPVASAGDVNGDGIGDLIIGARFANDRTGESYVVFGSASGFTSSLSLSTLDGNNGFRIDGIDPGDSAGSSVASAGDVNGDGIDDLIIGAYRADPGGIRDDAGESYVVFGSRSDFGSSLSLSDLDGTNGFRLDGVDPADLSGNSVASAGDVNGDGLGDLIIGAPFGQRGDIDQIGESYVVFGSTADFGASLSLSALNGTNGFRLEGIDFEDRSGWSVASAGDVNGDGFDDVIIGAPQADANSNRDAGESYVVFGAASGFAPSLLLSDLNGTNGFRLDGIDRFDISGWSVASAGDVNADGIDDVIIGAQGADRIAGGPIGAGYVVFGSTSGFTPSLLLSTLNGANGFRIDGIDPGDSAGRSVASAGDVNGDGIDDVIIGADGADPNDIDLAGESYVIFGRDATAPTLAPGQALPTPENRSEGATIGRVIATDHIGVTGFSIDGGDPGGFFAIDAIGRITLTAAGVASAANDFETGANSFTLAVTATDAAGNAATEDVTVTVTDVNEPAVVTGRFTGAVTEGDPGDVATATGTLAISDVDAGDTPSFADVAPTAGSNGFGSFVLAAGTWTYTLDQGAVQDLDAGDTVTDTITFTATDGTAQAVTVTITGTDDENTNGSEGGTTGDGEGDDGPTGEDGANDGGGAPTGDGGPDEDDVDGGPDAPASEDAPARLLLRGTEGRDRIFGTAADERFEGLGARDVLVSGGGDDLMIGGAGPDFFAFARVDAPGRTEVTDFGPRDFIVLDDQFFGLGDATIDLRGVTLDQVLTAVRAGLVALDREAGTLSVDPGRDARGETPDLTIALGDGLSDLGVSDVFLA